MSKLIDLVGQRFGRLTVLYRAENNKYGSSRWHCFCDCGNECVVGGNHLQNGDTKSCGCYQKECASDRQRKTNEYEVYNDYIIAKTNNGIEFFVDNEDEWVFRDYCWHLDGNGHILAYERSGGKYIGLHRLIMNCPNDMVVDHINGNPLDNRKSNLRIATRQQNQMNKSLSVNNTSGITGVSFDRARNKWIVHIGVNYKRLYLGRFDSFEDAVSARREAEEKYFGEYSYYNSRVACSN